MKSNANRRPDPHALGIARAVQKQVAPDTVILFGSRATGDYREDSDVDILVVTQDKERRRDRPGAGAGDAAKEYMESHPPLLEVGIMSMTRSEFDRNRRAKQHLAGQADHHGVLMSGERLDYQTDYEDGYPVHWPATKKRLENTAEWGHHFNDMVDQDYWNQKVTGFAAQQAVENALKGWLSTFNDPSRFGHDLNSMRDYLERIQDRSQPDLEELHESLTGLFDHTRYDNPKHPSGRGNWLTDYADVYRYDVNPRPMTQEEKRELRQLVNKAIEGITERTHRVSGTGDTEIYTEGKRRRKMALGMNRRKPAEMMQEVLISLCQWKERTMMRRFVVPIAVVSALVLLGV